MFDCSTASPFYLLSPVACARRAMRDRLDVILTNSRFLSSTSHSEMNTIYGCGVQCETDLGTEYEMKMLSFYGTTGKKCVPKQSDQSIIIIS